MNITDLQNFRIGDIVSIPDLEDYQKIRIDRISDSGVTVYGNKCGANVILSCKSPAYLVKRGEQTFDAPTGIPAINNNAETSDSEGGDNNNGERVKRGTYTERMKNLTIIDHKPFTIKEFAALNDIPINYALAWIKTNCVEAGYAERVEGQRGKSAMLYVA